MSNKAKTILFLCADPTDETRLRLGQEIRDIEQRLAAARLRTKFHFVPKTSVRLTDLSQYFLDHKPHIVHFSGHGDEQGELCFEDDNGRAKTAPKEAIARLFALSSDKIECVVLNACFSEPQARVILASVPTVIGMRTEIDDPAAIAFAAGFYKAIGAGKSPSDAFDFGTLDLDLLSMGNATPILFEQKPRFPVFVPGHTKLAANLLKSRYVELFFSRSASDLERAYINPAAFTSLQSLLDDLYLNWLHKYFEPYTYGRSWWLTLRSGVRRFRRIPLVPLSWFRKHAFDVNRKAPDWGSEKPSYFGLQVGCECSVETPENRTERYLVFAANPTFATGASYNP
jgi:hypothetical protein